MAFTGQIGVPAEIAGRVDLRLRAVDGYAEGFGGSVVELLELDGGEVIDRAVRAFGVEPLDPAGRSDLDLIDVPPRAIVMDRLGLVETDLRLRE